MTSGIPLDYPLRTGLISLLLGISLIVLGLNQSLYGLLISWLGLSFLLTGLAYLRLIGTNLYGKTNAGYIPMRYRLLHGPFLLYTWFSWHLVQALLKENAYDLIHEQLIIGRRLSTQECPDNISNYIDLTVEFNEPPALLAQVNYILLPMLDGHVPDLAQLEHSFHQLRDGLTYIHCAQGHGRTGLYAALLLYRQGVVTSAEDALQLLQAKRPALSLTKVQKDFLHRYLAQQP